MALLEGKAEDLVLAEDLDEVPGELPGLVDLGRARRDALARERANELADLALILRERVIAHLQILRRRPRFLVPR